MNRYNQFFVLDRNGSLLGQLLVKQTLQNKLSGIPPKHKKVGWQLSNIAIVWFNSLA